MSLPNISSIINDSLYGDDALFVLSASSHEERGLVQDLLREAWQRAQRDQSIPHVRDLSIVRISFPWSEHPAHSLYTSIIELRELSEWEMLLLKALRDGRSRDVTTNTHIAAVLEGMVHRGRLGTHEFTNKYSFGELEAVITPLFRSYLLDQTSQASERSKLGFARALTTQDRYELLRCLWQCEQGLASSLDVREHTRLWVYLDEAENVLDYTPAERKMLSKGLAHIIAQTGHFLTIWLNIAVQDRETVQAVKKALGDLLWQWLDFDFTKDALSYREQGIDQ